MSRSWARFRTWPTRTLRDVRSRIARWAIAAAVTAAAVVSTSALTRWHAQAGGADPEAEAAVLAQTIKFFEQKFERDRRNYLVANRLVDDHLLRFQLDSDLSHLRRAETIAREVLLIAPDTAVAFARLSLTLLSQHDFAGALEAAERAVTADSTDEAALSTLFDAALAAGRYGMAERALRALDPKSSTRRLRDARWLGALGELDHAFATMERLCRRFERGTVRRQVVAWCQTLLADLEHGRSGAEAAEHWYRRALRTQPGYIGAVEGLADFAYAREEWKKAKKLYRSILSEAHPDLYLRLAEVSAALGETEAATAYELESLRLATAPGAEALNAGTLAVYYSSRPDRADLALAVAQRDTERRSSIEAFEVLSWVHLTRGELKQALAASNSSRRWGQSSVTSDYIRARILEDLGRADEALPLYARALADPTQLDHHVLQELWSRQREIGVAAHISGSP